MQYWNLNGVLGSKLYENSFSQSMHWNADIMGKRTEHKLDYIGMHSDVEVYEHNVLTL